MKGPASNTWDKKAEGEEGEREGWKEKEMYVTSIISSSLLPRNIWFILQYFQIDIIPRYERNQENM